MVIIGALAEICDIYFLLSVFLLAAFTLLEVNLFRGSRRVAIFTISLVILGRCANFYSAWIILSVQKPRNTIMNTLNKNLLMGGVAACAVAFASCGEKTDSAAAASGADKAVAAVKGAADEVVAAATTETVSINLSGLK
jgi:hypothetical protein